MMEANAGLRGMEALKNLPHPQQAVILAMLGGARQKDAAKEAGVTPRAVRYWQNEPQFREAMRAGREALLSETATRLQGLAEQAVDTLRVVMKSRRSRGYEKVAAAK